MPKSNMYCIYDKVGEESGPVFHSKNDAVAIRHYDLMIQNNEPAWKSDFELAQVGVYDHYTRVITPEVRIIPTQEADDAETI